MKSDESNGSARRESRMGWNFTGNTWRILQQSGFPMLTGFREGRGKRRLRGNTSIENADPIGKSLPTTPYHLDGFAWKKNNRLRKLLPTCTRIEASK